MLFFRHGFVSVCVWFGIGVEGKRCGIPVSDFFLGGGFGFLGRSVDVLEAAEDIRERLAQKQAQKLRQFLEQPSSLEEQEMIMMFGGEADGSNAADGESGGNVEGEDGVTVEDSGSRPHSRSATGSRAITPRMASVELKMV